MPQTTNLYLYLVRRDKKGVRLLAKFLGNAQLAVRIEDIAILQLPPIWQDRLGQIIYDNRMLWEPWIESSNSFDELLDLWKSRGLTGLPVSPQPEYAMSNVETPTANVAYLPRKTTMLRRRH